MSEAEARIRAEERAQVRAEYAPVVASEARLREALGKLRLYVSHEPCCDRIKGNMALGTYCDCGLRALEEQIDSAALATPPTALAEALAAERSAYKPLTVAASFLLWVYDHGGSLRDCEEAWTALRIAIRTRPAEPTRAESSDWERLCSSHGQAPTFTSAEDQQYFQDSYAAAYQEAPTAELTRAEEARER